ncbi:SH3 domain-containing protein [Acetatifactor muris]|uniref:Bacterial SH3 domain protein n=1 Tax=Acetatifactor muris TaxID=879566 RepID=A0A2K4ZE79_9FIRM|nr:SH3 domain-containing protein [Acetatifactor muris]MCR2047160.1 SH3 domain-containing protein [Acetatifactor muris]SOY28769.1 Bacterial SH3 domain protein [Acetatifactor muris]
MKKKIVMALLITAMTASAFAGCGNRMEGDGRVQAMADTESSQDGNADSQESGAEGTGAMESEPEETAEPTEEPSAEETPEPTAEPETGVEAPSDGNDDESGSVTQTGQSGSADQTDEANQTDEADQTGTTTGEETADSPYTINEMENTMYAKSVVNVRNQPSTDGEKVGRLSYGQEVTVTGQCKETGWYQIELNGEKAFVSNSYIIAEKPATTTTTRTAGNTNSQGSGSGQTANQSSDSNQTTAKTDDASTDAQLVNSEFAALLNADRQVMGLSTVSADGTLDSNALESAKAIVSNFSHDATAPTRGGANVENIASGYNTVADVYAAWKASPGHWAAMIDPGLQYISVARCGNYWVYLGYAKDIIEDKYMDENGNIDIDAAVNNGDMHEISSVTDPETGKSQTVYGTDGVMSLEEAIEKGEITQEEADAIQDIFDNWYD